MGGKKVDRVGVRFGLVVGIRTTGKDQHGNIVWLWRCDCGGEFEATAGNFVRKKWSSGCPECAEKFRLQKTVDAHYKHGLSHSKEYNSYTEAKQRCFNPEHSVFALYGGRGIVMCDEWKYDFSLFLSHIGPMPDYTQRWTLDRINNNKNYEPGNVRWALPSQQARNRRKRSTNTSGITGVSLDEKCPGHFYAVALWSNLDGKLKTKSFSFKKFGEAVAVELATSYRKQMIAELNEQGAGYTDAHGL